MAGELLNLVHPERDPIILIIHQQNLDVACSRTPIAIPPLPVSLFPFFSTAGSNAPPFASSRCHPSLRSNLLSQRWSPVSSWLWLFFVRHIFSMERDFSQIPRSSFDVHLPQDFLASPPQIRLTSPFSAHWCPLSPMCRSRPPPEFFALIGFALKDLPLVLRPSSFEASPLSSLREGDNVFPLALVRLPVTPFRSGSKPFTVWAQHRRPFTQ